MTPKIEFTSGDMKVTIGFTDIDQVVALQSELEKVKAHIESAAGPNQIVAEFPESHSHEEERE